jgi:hypothetical protein
MITAKGGKMHKGLAGFGLILIFSGFFLVSSVAFGQVKAKTAGASKEGKPMAIARMVVGTGVDNREPQGVAEKFSAQTEKVYCFVEVANIPQDQELTLVWYAGNKPAGEISLSVKQGPKWRTWAYKNLWGIKGDWKAEIKTSQGKILKETQFKVE